MAESYDGVLRGGDDNFVQRDQGEAENVHAVRVRVNEWVCE